MANNLTASLLEADLSSVLDDMGVEFTWDGEDYDAVLVDDGAAAVLGMTGFKADNAIRLLTPTAQFLNTWPKYGNVIQYPTSVDATDPEPATDYRVMRVQRCPIGGMILIEAQEVNA